MPPSARPIAVVLCTAFGRAGCTHGAHRVVLALFTLLHVSLAQSETAPACPIDGDSPTPPFSAIGDPPNVSSWSDLTTLPENCHISLHAPAQLTIALAGAFAHTGSVEEIASRLGAISTTQGLLYWSVTDQDWRELVSEAFALNSRDTDDPRPDFSSEELLSGKTLYFAQNDTRSWGQNIYSLKVIGSSADHLVFKTHNSSPIRIGPVTLFKSEDAQSVIFLQRMDNSTWTSFSLSVIKHSALPARKESLTNRQAAFYRLLTGQPPDKDPPLAR